jgi:hypothetical protein
LQGIALLIIILVFSVKLHASVPCWINQPVTEEIIGFIGVANSFSVLSGGAELSSRKRALTQLLDFYALEPPVPLDLHLNPLVIDNSHTVLFADSYDDGSSLFTYVSLVTEVGDLKKLLEWQGQQCSQSVCEFNKCSPKWLCSNTNSVYGVSQLTSNPADQLATTKKNAVKLLEYLTKSAVKGDSYRVRSVSKNQSWGVWQESSSVIPLDTKIHSLLLKNICQTSNYMFSEFELPDSITLSPKPFSQWLKEPSFEKKIGVVGSFSGMTADGLIRTSIEKAIKNGLLEMAKAKEIDITNEYRLVFNHGWYSVSKTQESTSGIVSARLVDFAVTEENAMLIFYAWLVEN